MFGLAKVNCHCCCSSRRNCRCTHQSSPSWWILIFNYASPPHWNVQDGCNWDTVNSDLSDWTSFPFESYRSMEFESATIEVGNLGCSYKLYETILFYGHKERAVTVKTQFLFLVTIWLFISMIIRVDSLRLVNTADGQNGHLGFFFPYLFLKDLM